MPFIHIAQMHMYTRAFEDITSLLWICIRKNDPEIKEFYLLKC